MYLDSRLPYLVFLSGCYHMFFQQMQQCHHATSMYSKLMLSLSVSTLEKQCRWSILHLFSNQIVTCISTGKKVAQLFFGEKLQQRKKSHLANHSSKGLGNYLSVSVELETQKDSLLKKSFSFLSCTARRMATSSTPAPFRMGNGSKSTAGKPSPPPPTSHTKATTR